MLLASMSIPNIECMFPVDAVANVAGDKISYVDFRRLSKILC